MGQMSIAIQEDVKVLQEQLQALDTVYEPPVRHMFLDGMYYREMFALKDSMLIGAHHKKACFNILLEGEIVVSNGEGEVVLKAPQTFINGIGIQKIGYCLTDVLWANVFRTEATTVEEAEQELFEETIYKETEWLER